MFVEVVWVVGRYAEENADYDTPVYLLGNEVEYDVTSRQSLPRRLVDKHKRF